MFDSIGVGIQANIKLLTDFIELIVNLKESTVGAVETKVEQITKITATDKPILDKASDLNKALPNVSPIKLLGSLLFGDDTPPTPGANVPTTPSPITKETIQKQEVEITVKDANNRVEVKQKSTVNGSNLKISKSGTA